MHISPDDVSAAITGAAIVLGVITVGIGKAWTVLRGLKEQMVEVKAQTGPNGENAARIAGQQAADTSAEVLTTLNGMRTSMDAMAAGQQRLEERTDEMLRNQHGMARDIGRLGDADQRIESTAHDEHERIWNAIAKNGDHVTPHTNSQEDS